MPLQNRVDPFGDIHSVADRGLFTGNRGVIHDPATKTLLKRRWATRAWIVCDLVHPRGVRREPMGRNAPSGHAGWTELFFLDEVTALAAGHRPCFYCRRERAVEFAKCFAVGQHRKRASAPEMDAVLHPQRRAAHAKPTFLDHDEVRELPDGVMIAAGAQPNALRHGKLLPWSFDGYGKPAAIDPRVRYELLTPAATVATLRAGYEPLWHPGAEIAVLR